jgi:hypothetical protein
MGDLALAIERNRNQRLSSLIAVRERVNAICGHVKYPDDRWYVDDRVPYAGQQ